MLIVTPRHTMTDLQMWEDYRQVDMATCFPWRKLADSINVVRKWRENHIDGVAYTSWGKDSVVLLTVIVESGIDVPVVYVRTDRSNPDCLLVRDQFLKMFQIDYREHEYEYAAVNGNDGHWKDIARRYGDHRITGIRNDESGRRQLVWNIYGFESEHSCRPLAKWRSHEVFAYIEQMKLPLCPVYGYLGGGRYDRSMLRTHSIVGSSGDGMGRKEWEKEYYGDIVNRIQSGLPSTDRGEDRYIVEPCRFSSRTGQS